MLVVWPVSQGFRSTVLGIVGMSISPIGTKICGGDSDVDSVEDVTVFGLFDFGVVWGLLCLRLYC